MIDDRGDKKEVRSNMKMMDCVEVIVEKEKYAKHGVHKGMQGVIWLEECIDGEWDVYFSQCGEKDKTAEMPFSGCFGSFL